MHAFSLHLFDLFSEEGSLILKVQDVGHRLYESSHVKLSTICVVRLRHEDLIDHLLVEHTKLTKLE